MGLEDASTEELFHELMNRTDTFVCAYRAKIEDNEPFSFRMTVQGDVNTQLGLCRRLWHNLDKIARRNS